MKVSLNVDRAYKETKVTIECLNWMIPYRRSWILSKEERQSS